MATYVGLSCIIVFVLLIRVTNIVSQARQCISPVLNAKHIIFCDSLTDLEKERAVKKLAFCSLRNFFRLIILVGIVFGFPVCLIVLVHFFGWTQYQDVFSFLSSTKVIIIGTLFTVVVALKK